MPRSDGLKLADRQKAGRTKREQLEEEFGIPFEKAIALRRVYYGQGYDAARRNYSSRLNAMASRLEGALATIREWSRERDAT
jgi:uncharacterized protein (DUF2164 family)